VDRRLIQTVPTSAQIKGKKMNTAIPLQDFRSIVLDMKVGESLVSFNEKKAVFKECLISSLLSSIRKDSILREVEQSKLNVHRVFAMNLAPQTVGARTTLHVLRKDADAIMKQVNTASFHYAAVQCLETQTNIGSIDFTPASIADDDERQEALSRLNKPPSEGTKIVFAVGMSIGLMGAAVFLYDGCCRPEMQYQRVGQDKKNSSLADANSSIAGDADSFSEMYEQPGAGGKARPDVLV
jgi:hypothetical protein